MISVLSLDFTALAILAIIQGVTEFLPISSSGHLVLAQTAMGLDEPALALDVALHVGTLAAVAIVYRRDILRMLKDARGGELREPLLIVLASLPAGIVGIAFRDRIQGAFQRPAVAAVGLFVTGAVLLVGEWARRRGLERADAESERPMLWRHALLIGVFQAFAILPGISRSGATIGAAMLCGMPAKPAARFSFLLSIPAILGAAVLNVPAAVRDDLGGGGLGAILWASALAGFVGWGALRVLIEFVGRGAFVWFALYCVVLGTGALIFV